MRDVYCADNEAFSRKYNCGIFYGYYIIAVEAPNSFDRSVPLCRCCCLCALYKRACINGIFIYIYRCSCRVKLGSEEKGGGFVSFVLENPRRVIY